MKLLEDLKKIETSLEAYEKIKEALELEDVEEIAKLRTISSLIREKLDLIDQILSKAKDQGSIDETQYKNLLEQAVSSDEKFSDRVSFLKERIKFFGAIKAAKERLKDLSKLKSIEECKIIDPALDRTGNCHGLTFYNDRDEELEFHDLKDFREFWITKGKPEIIAYLNANGDLAHTAKKENGTKYLNTNSNGYPSFICDKDNFAYPDKIILPEEEEKLIEKIQADEEASYKRNMDSFKNDIGFFIENLEDEKNKEELAILLEDRIVKLNIEIWDPSTYNQLEEILNDESEINFMKKIKELLIWKE